MELLLELFYGLSVILALGIGGFFLNVFLHELGHAIPILFWSKKRVSIYIGSFGDPTRSLIMRIGRLDVYLKYNPFRWMRGLCKSEERLPVNKIIVYTAMGPLSSLLVTLVCLLLLKTADPSHDLRVVLVTIMVIGGSLVLSSAIPMGKLHGTFSGKAVTNDMMQVIRLWKKRKMPERYWEARDKFFTKEYSKAAELLEEAIGKGNSGVEWLRLAVNAQLASGRFERAGELLEMIRTQYRLSLEDQINDGCHKILIGRFREAVAIHTDLLRLHYDHFLILNNMAYALIASGEPQKALPYIDRGITLAPRFPHLHVNRGWARMELGQWDEGLESTQFALQIDNTLASGYRNLGLYALEKDRNEEARDHFLKAKALDAQVQFVDAPLIEAERRIRSSLGQEL
jgi:tetratricopeptide (TPR) repeat protein